MLTVAKIVAAIKAAAIRANKVRTNQRGNTIYDFYTSDAERYIVDFAPDFTTEGWMQFDTSQDACYFGVWVNPSKLLVLTFAEGDWSLIECPDADHYNAEIQCCCDFYSPGFECIACDTVGSITAILTGGTPGPDTKIHMQDRRKFFRK